jgi:hypothetical protein
LDRVLDRIPSRGLRSTLTPLIMKRFSRVPLLGCAGRQIPDSATGEQHFDQEGQERAHGEKKREPEGNEQGNPGLISKRSDEQKQGCERCRDAAQSPIITAASRTCERRRR